MQQEIKKILQPQAIETVLIDNLQNPDSVTGTVVEPMDIMDIPGDAHTILQTLAKMV